jgi:hypothetical protein
MSTLAGFQAAFVDALYADDAGLPASHPAFAVYRNTVMRGCLDALEANFPAVVCLVGREWFRAAAAIHAAQQPPRDARMMTYGDGFADFLAGFEPARELVYLPDVARLDRLWSESYIAADAGTLDASALQALPPDRLGERRLSLHPATRWLATPLPVVSIWQASRTGMAVADDLAWQAEPALVTRVGGAVRVAAVPPASLHFVEACAAGHPLAEAAERTRHIQPDARIDLILSGLLSAGAFATT